MRSKRISVKKVQTRCYIRQVFLCCSYPEDTEPNQMIQDPYTLSLEDKPPTVLKSGKRPEYQTPGKKNILMRAMNV